ncbi:MAG: hypothetical protein ACI8QY_000715 [bacterium]|jgi:hypothetical protein
MKKILSVALIATILMVSSMANAGNKIIQLDNDAVKLIVTIGDGISRETTVKTFFFQEGLVCHTDIKSHSCLSYNVNPLMGRYYRSKCEAYAKDKTLCQTTRDYVEPKEKEADKVQRLTVY